MASTARVFGAIRHKVPIPNALFSSFVSLHNSSALQSTILLNFIKIFFVTVRSQYFFFIFGLGIGFLGRISSAMEFGGGQRVKRISTTFPVCMGRRSCKIAGRKVRFLVSNICFFFPCVFF